jgi:ferrous iron transport protein A
MITQKNLGELKKGQSGIIVAVGNTKASESSEKRELVRRLLDLGFAEGGRVQVVLEAPFGGDPFAIRVRGGVIALRREEANLIKVEGDF